VTLPCWTIGCLYTAAIDDLCEVHHAALMRASRTEMTWYRAAGCDICGDPIAWRHPAGGARCEACPRPELP
jgi:hypothetical protein